MPRLTDYRVWIFECDGTLVARRGAVGHGFTRDAEPVVSQAIDGRPTPTASVFPDTATALLYLKKYVRLVAATEIEPDLFAASGERFGVQFEAVITLDGNGRSDEERAERLRAALSSFNVEGREILFVVGGASAASRIVHRLGVARCRIARGALLGLPPATEAACEFDFANLAELVIAHQDAVRAP